MFEHLRDPRPPDFDDDRRLAVHARAAHMRDRARRQRRGVGASVAAVLLVGVATVISRSGAPADVVAASEEIATTTSTVVADTTTTPPDTAPVTMIEATSVPPTEPPPTEPPAPVASCPPWEPFRPLSPEQDLEFDNRFLDVTARLDRTVLARGEGLSIHLEARNTTPEEIEVRTDADYRPNARIRDTSGNLLWLGSLTGSTAAISSSRIGPGGIETYTLTWNSEVCATNFDQSVRHASAQLAPGVYTVETTWLGHVPASMTFEVR